MVLDFGVTGIYHTLPEFVGNLYLASKKLSNKIKVNVYAERIRYNNSRKPDVYDELSFRCVLNCLHCIGGLSLLTFNKYNSDCI